MFRTPENPEALIVFLLSMNMITDELAIAHQDCFQKFRYEQIPKDKIFYDREILE